MPDKINATLGSISSQNFTGFSPLPKKKPLLLSPKKTTNKSIPVKHNIEIPKEIHLIWLGSILPEEYLENLYNLVVSNCKNKFKINLWVDDKNNFYSAIEKSQLINKFLLSTIAIDAFKKSINIKNIKEIILLYNQVSPESLKIDLDSIKAVLLIADQERIGTFRNYAAAADIYRYLILYISGGVYIDIDNKVNFSRTYDQQTSLDIKASYGFLHHAIGENAVNNDLLASAKYHPILKKLLIAINKNYRNLSQEEMNNKRSKFPTQQDCNLTENRRTWTIRLTGPQALNNAVHFYLAEHNLSNRFPLMFNYNGRGNIGFFDITSKSDMNWLNKNPKKPETDEGLYKIFTNN